MPITVDEIVSLLNSAFNADPQAMAQLIENRALCNKKLANHKSIQVGQRGAYGKHTTVGLLGILNGIAAIEDPDMRIVAEFTEGELTGFNKVHRNAVEPVKGASHA